MSLFEKQQRKLPAIKFLVSKGYLFSSSVVDSSLAPTDLQELICTKKIFLFTLRDPKTKDVVDEVVCEYGPTQTTSEKTWKELENS